MGPIQWIRRWLASEEEVKLGPCNKYGHDWQHKSISGYYASGVPHFGLGSSFTIERKDHYECSKCGRPDFRKTTVGKVKVDSDTDELTVVQ